MKNNSEKKFFLTYTLSEWQSDAYYEATARRNIEGFVDHNI